MGKALGCLVVAVALWSGLIAAGRAQAATSVQAEARGDLVLKELRA